MAVERLVPNEIKTLQEFTKEMILPFFITFIFGSIFLHNLSSLLVISYGCNLTINFFLFLTTVLQINFNFFS